MDHDIVSVSPDETAAREQKRARYWWER